LLAIASCAPPSGSKPGDPCQSPLGLPVDWSHSRMNKEARGLPMARILAQTTCTPASMVDAAVQPMPDAATPPSEPADLAVMTAPPDLATPSSDGGSTDGGPTDGGTTMMNNLDWNWPTSGAVTSTVALWVANYPNPDPADALFVATKGAKVYKLSNLYQPAPTLIWTASTPAPVDVSAVALSLDGQSVYALDTSGNLSCFAAATGGQCSGWTAGSVAGGTPVSLVSPWVDYASGDVFFNDNGGGLVRVDGAHGTVRWRASVSTTAMRSSPIVYNGFVYTGDDFGSYLRIRDTGATPPGPADVERTLLCAAPACSPSWAVAGGGAIDVGSGHLYVAAGGQVIELPLTGTWAPSGSINLGITSSAPVYSYPGLDESSNQLYVAYGNTLFQMPFPFPILTWNSVFLFGGGADASWPRSSPVPFNGRVYLGDGAGYAEQYGCLAAMGTPPGLMAVTQRYGISVDTTPLIDYLNGNTVFGYSTSGGGGGVVQITQAGGWGCGLQFSCASAGCGMGACAQYSSCSPVVVPGTAPFLAGGGGPLQVPGGPELNVSIASAHGVAVAPSGEIVTFGYFSEDIY
jgi:hypothetical protein